MTDLNVLSGMWDAKSPDRIAAPDGSYSNASILKGKVRDKSKLRKQSKPLMKEYKSFEEIFGDECEKNPYQTDLMKVEEFIVRRGWQKIPWKHTLGLFEAVYENSDFPGYQVVLMDLNDWEIRKGNMVISDGKGLSKLADSLDKLRF